MTAIKPHADIGFDGFLEKRLKTLLELTFSAFHPHTHTSYQRGFISVEYGEMCLKTPHTPLVRTEKSVTTKKRDLNITS